MRRFWRALRRRGSDTSAPVTKSFTVDQTGPVASEAVSRTCNSASTSRPPDISASERIFSSLSAIRRLSSAL